VFRRVCAVAGAATLSLSAFVALATPAAAAQHIYTSCSTLSDPPNPDVKADLSPPIGFTTQNSNITLEGTPTLSGCSGTDFTGSATLSASNVHTFKPGDCSTFAQGSPGKIIALGNFTATWSSGPPSSGALKAKGNNDGNPTHVVVVLKITSGQFLSPDSTNPTKIKSAGLNFLPSPGHGDCQTTPIDQVSVTNSSPFVMARKL
jgi:hypothetical protein